MSIMNYIDMDQIRPCVKQMRCLQQTNELRGEVVFDGQNQNNAIPNQKVSKLFYKFIFILKSKVFKA